MKLPSFQTEARLRDEVKATKTIAITIAASVFCYISALLFAAVVCNQKSIKDDYWFAFIVRLSIESSSTVNPIIYYTRTRSFQTVPKKPFGSSDYEERPNINESRVLEGTKNLARNQNGLDVKMDGNSTGEAYVRNQRDAMAILSVDTAKDNAGNYYADEKQLSRAGQRSECRVNSSLESVRTEKDEERKNSGMLGPIIWSSFSRSGCNTHTAAEDSGGAERKERAHHIRRKGKKTRVFRKKEEPPFQAVWCYQLKCGGRHGKSLRRKKFLTMWHGVRSGRSQT
ncbi:hypothetical protein AWC38_SpisGene22541 [Stylophora pistillata]|uniref:Uncharacterized protein n=1 Tax=Stylophora pistillata TaxID=50429 RepID=A0A2B4RAJ4_STYPI|nr:hypothetical protein AWC38_SpisGene22541 [Stylophora pistillata]